MIAGSLSSTSLCKCILTKNPRPVTLGSNVAFHVKLQILWCGHDKSMSWSFQLSAENCNDVGNSVVDYGSHLCSWWRVSQEERFGEPENVMVSTIHIKCKCKQIQKQIQIQKQMQILVQCVSDEGSHKRRGWVRQKMPCPTTPLLKYEYKCKYKTQEERLPEAEIVMILLLGCKYKQMFGGTSNTYKTSIK